MISISLASDVPIHDQLVAEIRRLIAAGTIAAGDELPPVRQLAADLGINLNTVARAYRDLTDAGLLSSSRGRGTVVMSGTERPTGEPAQVRRRIESSISSALSDAKLAGLSRDQTRDLINTMMARLWGPSCEEGASP
ncbi:MAG: GntR family transcriptional regulator [Phycisphaeraceae bacterium]|nr:GntR family transcriptional regulator [Phycisphaerae bacterium]MBX3392429.1 GntR family transcriptional regulator [Phycisphaeraceae bacterium]HRJ50900.1 GntR family transcriptional regulator [Phycisphaerales bacterium]